MRKELETAISEEQEKKELVERLREEFEEIKKINVQFYAEASGFQSMFEKAEALKKEKAMQEDNRRHMLEGMTEMSEPTAELESMLANFDSHLRTIEGKRSRQLELRDKEDEALDELRRRERNLASTQGGLIASRKVSCSQCNILNVTGL